MAEIRISRNAFVFGLWLFAVLILVVFQYLPTFINPAHSINHAQFKVLWTLPIKKLVTATPVIIGDVLVYGTNDGYLVGISKRDGHELWSLDLPDVIFAISQDSKTVYAGTGSHFTKKALLIAVNPVDGALLWKQSYEGHIEEPLRVDESTHQLWTGAGPSGLWSADTRNGSVLWNKTIGHLDGTPLLHDGILYMSAQKEEDIYESFFYALKAGNGDVLWKMEQKGQPWAAPLIDKTNNIVFTTTGEGQIGLNRPTDKGWAQAFSLQGKAVWETVLPNMAMTPGVYFQDLDLLIYTTKAGNVVALNALDGSVVWNIPVDTEFLSHAISVTHFKENLIATTSGTGTFYLINAQDGKIFYERKMGYRSNSAPVIDDKIIYISTGHNITALGEADAR